MHKRPNEEIRLYIITTATVPATLSRTSIHGLYNQIFISVPAGRMMTTNVCLNRDPGSIRTLP